MTISRLAEFRSLKGMTQKSLADALGVARTSVSAVENGHVEAWPRLRRDAAAILAVSEEDLFPHPWAGGCVGVAIVWSSRADSHLVTRLASLLLTRHEDEDEERPS